MMMETVVDVARVLPAPLGGFGAAWLVFHGHPWLGLLLLVAAITAVIVSTAWSLRRAERRWPRTG
jgi:hypothetical protein